MFLLKVVISVSLVVEVISISWVSQGYCKTSEGEGGVCMPLQYCRPFVKILKTYYDKGFTLRTLPENISKTLKKYECAIGRRSRICCPNTNIIKIVKPDPISLLPLDSCGKSESGNRIAHGGIANLYDFPWMAQLSYKKGNKNFCGGTLISEKYVLTAAHCINLNDKPESIIIRLGEYNTTSSKDCDNHPDEKQRLCIDEEPQDVEVEEIERHKLYNAEEFTNDIALLRLKTKVKMIRRVKPICLPVELSISNMNFSSVLVSGWGLTEKENRKNSEVLLVGTVGIVKSECCKLIIKTVEIEESQICLGNAECKEGKVITRSAWNSKLAQTCKGDSGGPIQQIHTIVKKSKYFKENESRYFQYGVISNGGECGKDGAGVHTRLDNYMPWILSHIKE